MYGGFALLDHSLLLTVNTAFPFFVINSVDFLKQNALVFILLPLDGYFIVILYMEEADVYL